MVDSRSTCALVATCDFNAKHFERMRREKSFDAIIALDGGYAHLQSIGVTPDFIIGDFDSLGYVPHGENVVVHPTKKDKSDLELGLDEAKARGYQAVYVYGALGGRLDHSVGALQMCAGFAEAGMDITLVGLSEMVHILVGPGSYDLPPIQSGTVSVFSGTDISIGVTERGLAYTLESADLRNRTTLGLSNELKGTPASISVENGTLYIFHPVE